MPTIVAYVWAIDFLLSPRPRGLKISSHHPQAIIMMASVAGAIAALLVTVGSVKATVPRTWADFLL